MIFGWGKSKQATQSYVGSGGVRVPYRPTYPIISETDRAFIGETIALLAANGLRLAAGMQEERLLDRLCRELVQFGYQDDGKPPKRWLELQRFPRYDVLRQLSMPPEIGGSAGEPNHVGPAFLNAHWFEDHCLDVATDYYVGLINSLCAMSEGDLSFDEIAEGISNKTQTVAVTLKRLSTESVISLTYGKDVDWSILKGVEAHLAPVATGRFGAIFDGSALVVYAPLEQLKRLGEIIGLRFYTG